MKILNFLNNSLNLSKLFLNYKKIIKINLIIISLLYYIPAINAYDQRFKTIMENNYINLEINLGNDYKIYWLYSGGIGQPTSINLNGSKNLRNYQIFWPFPEIKKKSNNIEYYYYTGNLSIPIYLTPENNQLPIYIKANLKYLLCKEQCIPISQTIEETINIKNDIKALSNTFNIKNISFNENLIEIIATFNQKIENPLFLIDQSNEAFVKNIMLEQLNEQEFKVKIFLKEGKYKTILGKIYDIYSNKTDLPAKLKITENINSFNLSFILISAIIGGFILNFMPCVLPILSLKLLSFTKSSNLSQTSLWLTTFGIISSFLSLGLVTVIFRKSSKMVGLGLNFQQPEFIIFLCLTLVIMISSSLNKINLNLPKVINEFLNNYHFKNNYLESFSSGVIATILSTPCNAPFFGTAIAFAISGSNFQIFLIFFLASIGFSAPYLCLILAPSLIKYIPKPGRWTLYLRNFLIILLISSLTWLLIILYAQTGLRPVFGFLMLLVLLKFFLELKESIFSKALPKFLSIILIIISSFYLPKNAYKENIAHMSEINNTWQKFDINKLKEYINEDKLVVVDITADWCVTCKFNKLMVWDRASAIKLIKQNNIIAMRGDYTKENSEIYDYLKSNGTYGVPFNKVYGPELPKEIILPILLSYNDIKKAIKQLIRK